VLISIQRIRNSSDLQLFLFHNIVSEFNREGIVSTEENILSLCYFFHGKLSALDGGLFERKSKCYEWTQETSGFLFSFILIFSSCSIIISFCSASNCFTHFYRLLLFLVLLLLREHHFIYATAFSCDSS